MPRRQAALEPSRRAGLEPERRAPRSQGFRGRDARVGPERRLTEASGHLLPADRAQREHRAAAPQPADAAGTGRPKAERPDHRAAPQMARRQRPAGRECRTATERQGPQQEGLPEGAAGSARPMAERPDRRAEPLRAARLHRAGEPGQTARKVEERRGELRAPSARPAGVEASGGRRVPRWVRARGAAQQAPPVAWPGVPAVGAWPAARRAAAARASPEAASVALPARAASAAGAAPAAGRGPSVRPAAPDRAGRAGRLRATAGAVARAGRRLRRREPVRPGIRPERRPARLAKGRGPAGRSRPATSVSCASLFPSFVSTCGYQAACGLNPR